MNYNLRPKNLFNRRQAGLSLVSVLVIIAISSVVVIGGGVYLKTLKDEGKLNLGFGNLNSLVYAQSGYLDSKKVANSSFDTSIVGTVALSDGSYSAYKFLNGSVDNNGENFSKESKLQFLSGDLGLGTYPEGVIDPFYLADGTKTLGVVMDRMVASLVYSGKDNQNTSYTIKILQGTVVDGRLVGDFVGQTLETSYIIAGKIDDNGKITNASVLTGAARATDAEAAIASHALGLFKKISQVEGSRVLGVSTTNFPVTGFNQPIYDSKTGRWSLPSTTSASANAASQNVASYLQQLSQSGTANNLASQYNGNSQVTASNQSTVYQYLPVYLQSPVQTTTIVSGITEIKSATSGLKVSTSGGVATLSVDFPSSTTTTTVNVPDNSVTSSKIADYSINTQDFSPQLYFNSYQLLDLSAVSHSSSMAQGLRLPMTGSTPTSPYYGKGYIAYDSVNNQVIQYNGSSWQPVGGSGNILGLSTASGSGTFSTYSNSGLEINSNQLSLLKGCSDGQILKWNNYSKLWQCSNDSGSSSNGISIVQEADATLVSSANVLDFLGSDFTVTEGPTGEANVSIDYSNSNIVRSNQGQSITGAWTFSNGLTLGADTITDINGSGLSLVAGTLKVSGLTVSNFASPNISQFTNNSGYITGIAWGGISGSLSNQTDLQTALGLKVNTSSLGSAAYTSSTSYASASAVANLSGVNTGDNAVNSNYASDYRAANFIAGTNYLAPNGSAASLTNFPTLNQNTTGTASNITGVLGASSFPALTGNVTTLQGSLIATVSGLTVSSFTSNNISQWNNDRNYITGLSWGGITGTLSNQTDLISALNAKVDISSLGTAAYTAASAYATSAQGTLATNALPSTSFTDSAVTSKLLTGYLSGAGTISSTDSILSAIQKLNANDATNANLTGVVTSVGNSTSIANGVITNAMLANSAVANLSGTNTGDNAVNSNYASDYRAANFIVGTNYLAPTGSAASLTNFPTLNQNTTGTASNITGVLGASSFPAMTGDISNTQGSLSTAISSGAVTLAKMASLTANTIVGNNTGSAVTPIALTTSQVKTMLAITNGDISGLGTIATQASNNVSITGGSMSGLTSVSATTFTGALTGNASTVTGFSPTTGKTLSLSNSLTLSGTDGSTLNIGSGGTLGTAAYTAASAYATSAQGTLATNALPSTSFTDAAVSGKLLTGYISGAGTISATDTILQAIQKLNGNDATNANLTGVVTSIGNATSIANGAITNDMLANSAVANLSGTNTGDNAVNSNYSSDYRAANFVAGTNYLTPTGSAASLTNFPTLNQNTTGTALNITGVLGASSFPAMTGDVTNTQGNLSTTISSGAITLGKMANLTALTIIGNNTGSAATPIALTATQVKTLLGITTSDVSGLGTMATQNSNSISITGGSISGLTSISATSIAGELTGNASTVTNGLYSNGSYANPSWITSIAPSKVLPDQTGNSGKVLGTNGSTLSWVTNSSGVAWGAITGTLTDQTDLNTALGLKANTSSLGTIASQNSSAVSITGGSLTGLSGLAIRSTGTGAFDLTINNTENLTSGRTLTITTGNAARTLTLTGDTSISGTNTGDNATNSNYSSDYRAANFVAGTNYLAPNGSAASLTNFPTLNQNTTGTASNITGVLGASSFPAMTGDISNTQGSLSTTIANGVVTLGKMATLAANSIIGNNTGSAATPIALTATQVKTLLAIATGDISGLGTIATQASNNVSITGGSMSGLTSVSATTLTGALTGNATSATTATTGNALANTDAAGQSAITAINSATSGTINSARIAALPYLSTSLTSANIFVGNGSSVATGVTMSGDATIDNTGAITIGSAKITLTKMANMATASFLGRNTAGSGSPEVLSASTAKTMLGITTGDVSGLGTIATQASSGVTLTGGTIDGITIGGSTAAAGTFTTLTASTSITRGTDTITDFTGNGLTLSSGALTLSIPAATDALSSTTSNGSGLEVLSGGIALLQGCSDGQVLKWNETSDTWSCQNDSTSAGGGVATIKEGGTSVVTSTSILNFNASDFTITDETGGQAGIGIDYTNSKITRTDQSQTITGGWAFNTSTTFGAGSSITLGTSSSATGAVIFKNATNTNSVTLQSGTTSSGYTWTLPSADAAGCLQSNGSGTLSIATCGDIKTQTITSTGAGTYTKPAGAIMVIVEAVGAGGGGGGGGSNTGAVVRTGGSGGGGGAYNTKTYNASDLGATENYSVGAGGTAGTAGASGAVGGNGGIGGATTFGTTVMLTAGGGGGGRQGVISAAAGGGGGGGGTSGSGATGTTGAGTAGTPSGGTTNAVGGQGGTGNASATAGVPAEYGGGGGGGHTNVPANGAGGTSLHGGGGGGVGGGATVTPATVNATAGGNSGNYTTAGGGGGAAGTSGAAPTAGTAGATGNSSTKSGSGGGGGGGTITANTSGAAGGNGGAPGGGAGGGGVGSNTGTGGAGGTGGRGELRIWTIKGSGADLAEIYGSKEELEAGDVVALDSTLKAGVKKTTKAYDQSAFGIISTSPSLVMGSLEDVDAKPVMVALSGRVPVKVSMENGAIKPGDLLTPSSTPGVAMKATKSGQIIGQAMIGFEGIKGTDTENFGLIVAFIKNQIGNGQGLNELVEGLSTSGEVAVVSEADKVALAKLVTDKDVLGASTNLSEVNTDRVIAGLEIITPKLLADEITVRDLTASGLKVTGSTIFLGDVEFTFTPLFNSDTAGFAVIKEGSTEVQVNYEKEYLASPIVNVSPIWDTDQATLDVMKQLGTYILPKQDYIIVNSNTKGFTIVLDKPAVTDLKFSWMALAVKDARTVLSASTVATSSAAPDPSPSTTEASSSAIPEPFAFPFTTVSTPSGVLQGQTLKVNSLGSGYVRLRSEASTSGDELAQIPNGESVQYLDQSNGWYMVNYNDQIGWISGTYIELQ